MKHGATDSRMTVMRCWHEPRLAKAIFDCHVMRKDDKCRQCLHSNKEIASVARACCGEIWMAQMTARTLNEMTPAQRSDMMLLVAQALESVAEDADERGDNQSAQNAIYLACSIRGCDTGASTATMKAAEILLEHGISYVASVSERLEHALSPASSDIENEEVPRLRH